MTEELALHTAARRYCEERAAHWHTHYDEMGSHTDHASYTRQEKDVFPRYNVLEAILVEVERLRPETLTSAQEATEVLTLAGQIGESIFTKPPNGPVEKRAMQHERDLFCAYVNGLDADALAQVVPMPSRRTLTEEESKAIWERVDGRWGTAGRFWYPLRSDAPPDAIAFDADAFDEHIPAPVFQRILREQGLDHAFELREYGPEYELGLALLLPSYNGAEGYWTAGNLDWLVYASHECTITVAGGWLVQRVQQRWPTWSDHLVRW